MEISSLIEKLELAGLIQVKFKRKPSTGVHAFFNPATEELFHTFTSGYVRRTVPAHPYWDPTCTIRRQAPINQAIRKKHPLFGFRTSEQVLIPTEVERLEYLLKYMIRRKQRAVQKTARTGYTIPHALNGQTIVMDQPITVKPIDADLKGWSRIQGQYTAKAIKDKAESFIRTSGQTYGYNAKKNLMRSMLAELTDAFMIDVFCTMAIELKIEFVHNPKLEATDEEVEQIIKDQQIENEKLQAAIDKLSK